MKTTGIIILLVGLGLTLTTSLSFFTKEKVVDIGKLEITKASYFLNKVDSQMQLRIKEVIRLATENSMVRSRSPKSIVLTNRTLVQR